MAEYSVPTFEFGGKKIDLVVKTIPQMVEYNMENVSAQPGTLKILALRNGIRSISVDNKNRALYKREDDAQVFTLPEIREPGSRKGMGERILPEIIKHNDFLAFDERFSDTFADYLEDEDDGDDGDEDGDDAAERGAEAGDGAAKNPTEQGGSSTATPTPPGGGS